MSNFIDHSASEASEASGSDSDEEAPVATAKEGSPKAGSGSSSGSGSGSSNSGSDADSSEEEPDDDGVVEGLIDDNPIDDEGSEAEDSDADIGVGKRKKARSDEDDQLEEDDFDLIEENLGIKVKRNKHKRIKVMSDDDDSDQDGTNENDADAVANQIFGDDDEDMGDVADPDETSQSSAKAAEAQGAYGDLDDSEESDPDDFIVDEEGQPISKGKKKRAVVHSDKALQEAQDVFGVDFDFTEFEDYAGSEYEDEEDEEEEYEDEEGEGGDGTARKKRSRHSKKTIFEVFEPSELERGHMTDVDQEIRSLDIPERFHNRTVKVTPADTQELQDEAEWIFAHAFSQPTFSTQAVLADDIKDSRSVIKKINSALDFLRNQQLEVPFIKFYRKEYVENLEIRHLWRIWEWDEKWAQLRSRKQNLIKLMERMQQFQYDTNSNPDVVVPTHFRTISQDDTDRVRLAETTDEYWDCHNHFMLYYGKDIQQMKDAEKKKKKDKPAKTPKVKNPDDPDAPAEEKEDGEEDDEVEVEKPEDDTPVETLKYARGRNSGYHICAQNGLAELARKFGLTPEQFADNLKDNYQKHEVEQYPVEPMELAQEFIGPQFETPADVLNGVRHMVAMQIAHDPIVRKCIRQSYRERAVIKVTPTKRGKKEIDEHHQCYSMKYIINKPINDLKNEEYLKLHQACEEELLTISIAMAEPSSSTTYLDDIRPLFHRDEFSALVQAWNAQRSMALERALAKSIYPQLEKELKLLLLQEAKAGILRNCCDKLRSWVRVAPYQSMQEFDDEDEDFDTSKGLRIMSIGYKSERRDLAAYASVLDVDGEVSTFRKLPHILKRRNPNNQEGSDDKQNELNKLKDFILEAKPHVIAIAGESREALDIQYDVGNLIKQLEDEHQFPKIPMEMVDNEPSTVYAASKKSSQDFPDYPDMLRESISIARRLRDPLGELSQLCNPDEDLLCIHFHPMQEHLNTETLLSALYLEFVNIVNEVGVDINEALAQPYTAGLLQFVCGLGPRKAAYILKRVKSQTRLENRSQLVMICGLGPKVFINCAGFIKIDTSDFGDSTEEYTDVLDASRVHPETYEWARKMAIDALEYDENIEDANPAAALEEILEKPERLRDLDLEAFSVELERQGYGQKLTTLYDIRAELNSRYKDTRTQYKPIEQVERFNMLTKETPATFYIGKLVLCKVVNIARKKPQGHQLDEANPLRSEESGLWSCPFCKKDEFSEISEVWSHFDAGNCPGNAIGVRVRLENNLNGFIHTKNISDKEVKNPEERVRVGMTLHARILKIDIERFQVDLTCKTSDLLDKEDRLRPPKDAFYDAEAEDTDKKADEKTEKSKKRAHFIKRVIAHPSFHNVGFKECEQLLDELGEGECVIRPSSKGPDRLTMTWRLAPGIYSHIDIKEEGKENAFSLGKTLFIGTEEFEDLDEIIARYLQPMAAFARELQSYKYYVEDSGDGNREIMDRKVYEEKKKAPARIPYLFSTSKELPGKFMLSYMPRSRTVHEFVTVTHEGLRFRGQVFPALSTLVRWFKQHFRDAIPQKLVTPSQQATPRGVDSMRAPTFRTPGATPAYNTSRSGSSTSYPYGATPMMTPSLMTPSYHTTQPGGTPAYRGTPGQPSTSRSRTTPGGTPRAGTTPRPGATPRSGTTPRPGSTPRQGSTPRPGSTPRQGTTPRPGATPRSGQTPRQSGSTPRYNSSSRPNLTPRTNTETDWGKMALMWAKEQKQKKRERGEGTPGYQDQ